jgi:hypothetical protein
MPASAQWYGPIHNHWVQSFRNACSSQGKHARAQAPVHKALSHRLNLSAGHAGAPSPYAPMSGEAAPPEGAEHRSAHACVAGSRSRNALDCDCNAEGALHAQAYMPSQSCPHARRRRSNQRPQLTHSIVNIVCGRLGDAGSLQASGSGQPTLQCSEDTAGCRSATSSSRAEQRPHR